MSTRLTKDTSMPESNSLRLVFITAEVRSKLTEYAARKLKEKGYDDIFPSMLNFLGTLDCGVNYGSKIARNLKVSRQMVAKTVRELCRVGYLKQVKGRGKQKQILFTASGEKLMSEVRMLLSELDDKLYKQIGKHSLLSTISTLEEISEILIPELSD